MSEGRIESNATNGFAARPRRRPALWATGAALAAVIAGVPATARAENPVSGTGKGVAGGALLGGEVVTLTMGAVGVESTWPYLVFGGLGAVGGGIGGHFVETNADAEIPVYMLAGGMALVIPTVVVALDATAYKPPEATNETEVTTEPVPAPGVSAGASISAAAPAAPPRVSLVDLSPSAVAVGVPAVGIYPLYTPTEIATYGVAQAEEVRIPVLHATF